MSNELQKECCVETKLIALDWQWVTLTFWCQINRNGHSSPVMHKVEGKTHNILEKMKITSGKSTLFWYFNVKCFQITCVDICISLNKNDNTTILHKCLILCSSCLCSTARYLVVALWFLVMRVKKQKTKASSWFHKKLNFSEKYDFWQFLWKSWAHKIFFFSYKKCV